MIKVARRNKIFRKPLTAIIVLLAVFVCLPSAQALQKASLQKRKIVARGYLTTSREAYQVVTWQTANPPSDGAPYAKAHLAVETIGKNSRVVWETDGGDSQYLVDTVQMADLDNDGVSEIIGLWWVGASAGAELRIFHWDRNHRSFTEIPTELGGIYRFRIFPAKGNSRILVYTRSDRPASSPAPSDEYELRDLKLVMVNKKGGGAPVNGQSESGIEGEAVIGPIRPVIRVNDTAPDTAPYQTTLVIATAKERREVARVETGSDGKFRVNLPPGEYIVMTVRQGKIGGRASEEQVVVSAGAFTHVRMNFDSGIR
jgi:hypothetical protein